jgi:hypothetical protein
MLIGGNGGGIFDGGVHGWTPEGRREGIKSGEVLDNYPAHVKRGQIRMQKGFVQAQTGHIFANENYIVRSALLR